MSFYQELSKDNKYDKIFPMRESVRKFLLTAFAGKHKIIDVAMGTGNYTKALREDGFHVIGIEYDKDMLAAAKDKVSNDTELLLGSMSDLSSLVNNAEGIFCIGNSIVHLPSLQDVEKTVSEMYKVLEVEGKLVLQLINYDRIMDQEVSGLPTIKVEDEALAFERNYYLKDGMIDFEGIVRIHDKVVSEERVSLLPIRYQTIEGMLEKVGFKNITTYGGFDKSAFDIEKSIPLVIVAEK